MLCSNCDYQVGNADFYGVQGNIINLLCRTCNALWDDDVDDFYELCKKSIEMIEDAQNKIKTHVYYIQINKELQIVFKTILSEKEFEEKYGKIIKVEL